MAANEQQRLVGRFGTERGELRIRLIARVTVVRRGRGARATARDGQGSECPQVTGRFERAFSRCMGFPPLGFRAGARQGWLTAGVPMVWTCTFTLHGVSWGGPSTGTAVEWG
jgi:hypothetical protein